MRTIRTRYTIEDGDVYHNDELVDGAEAASFVVHREGWANDANRVYYRGYTKRIDASTFVFLNPLFVKDSKNVYDWEGKLKSADPATFRVLDSGLCVQSDEFFSDLSCIGYAADAKKVYFQDQMAARAGAIRYADPATFVSLGDGYGRDARYVYCRGIAIKDADRDTWTYLGRGYSTDQEKCFYWNTIIEGADPRLLTPCQLPTIGNYASDGERFYWGLQVVPPDEFHESVDFVELLLRKRRDEWPGGGAAVSKKTTQKMSRKKTTRKKATQKKATSKSPSKKPVKKKAKKRTKRSA